MELAADDRLAFAPPPQAGLLRGLGLAVIAHLLLLAALTSGLHWKRDSTELAAEAELWSAMPQQAAPKEVPAPPPPPPPPTPVPVPRAPPQPDPQVQRDAQIALERQKQQREEAKREEARREEARREAAERRQAEQERERDRRRKLEAERKRQEELEQREQTRLAAEAKRKEETRKEAQKKREQQDETRVARLREENLRRIQGLAGGTGAPTSSGNAAQSSGPSASWGARVSSKVRPNIVFTDDVAGNPTAGVEVRMAPDGTIVSKRLVKPSGNKSWDDAVLRALDKTEVLPRDTDGRVPREGVILFRPKD
jgi:colicin import membrane protein